MSLRVYGPNGELKTTFEHEHEIANDAVTQAKVLLGYVDLSSAQAITGAKRFSDLGVDGGTASTFTLDYDNVGGGYAEFLFADNVKTKWSIGNVRSGVAGSPNSFYIFQYTDSSGSNVNSVRLRIMDNGDVGIGINPTEKLHVSGNAKITGVINPQLTVSKSADQTINSDSTLTDDADLVVAVEADTNYRFECHVLYEADATPDFQMRITVPTAATLRGTLFAFTGSGGGSLGSSLIDENTLIPMRGGTGTGRINVTGVLSIAGTAGNVVMQWAQDTSDAGDTTLLEGSHMILTKLG